MNPHAIREGSSGPSGAREAGLAPEDARGWLELQARYAWHPEAIAPLVRAGHTPEEILCRSGAGTGCDGSTREVGPHAVGIEVATARLVRLGARVVPLGRIDYPEPLRALDDAPLVLSVRGRAEILATPAIAIVGARAATLAAREIARRLAYDLARAGFTIVSGLARGIDGEAHRGALEAGGRTIGVLACGIDRIYPPEHRGLAEEMTLEGAIVSELPVGSPPQALHFPLRNRIISGLSRGVIVVEARRRSGSLITVRHALAQGREVFVVPGSALGPFAAGTNQLLREGARAIQSACDVLEDLGVEATLPAALPRASGGARASGGSPISSAGPPSTLAERVMALLAAGPRTRDALIFDAGLDAGRLATALLELQLDERIVEERDGRIHLAAAGHASMTRQ